MKALCSFFYNLFYPLFIPLFCGLILVWSNPIAFNGESSQLTVQFIYILVLATVLMPGSGVLLLEKSKLFSAEGLTEQQKRIRPFFILISCYSIALYYLIQLSIPPIALSMLFGALIAIILTFFAENFMEVSYHSVGMACLLGIVLLLPFFAMRGTTTVLIITLLLCGIVLSSVLYLQKGNISAMPTSFLIGLISQLFMYNVIQLIAT